MLQIIIELEAPSSKHAPPPLPGLLGLKMGPAKLALNDLGHVVLSYTYAQPTLVFQQWQRAGPGLPKIY